MFWSGMCTLFVHETALCVDTHVQLSGMCALSVHGPEMCADVHGYCNAVRQIPLAQLYILYPAMNLQSPR